MQRLHKKLQKYTRNWQLRLYITREDPINDSSETKQKIQKNVEQTMKENKWERRSSTK